jgi:peptide-methionine (S)-S-oxide reductase
MTVFDVKALRYFGRVLLISLSSVGLAYGAARLILPSPTVDKAIATANAFPDPAIDISASTEQGKQNAILAGGCFWGMEAIFEHLKGVSEVVSGYSGGTAETAHYETVGTGQTGHAESIKITYDPSQITYGQLLKIYFSVAHNPTELNRQESDVGTQYRSAIFFVNPEQQRVANAYINQLNAAHSFRASIVTQVIPLKGFYVAERYHQDFIAHNPNYPYVVVHDLPKLKRLQQIFPSFYRN